MGLPAVITGKPCTCCGVWKPFDCFNVANDRRYGRQAYCQTCSNLSNRLWFKQNRTRALTKNKTYRAQNRERLREQQRKRRYGITVQQYDQMIVDQDGRCLLCLVVFDEETPYVDHCHDTGRVRGLLCNKCNRSLHCAENDPEWLDRAKEYLCAA